MIKINNLCITVNEHEILKNVSCTLPDDALHAV